MRTVDELVAYLKKCDDAYYNTSSPLVSDSEYDALVSTLRLLDSTHEYLNKVGSELREGSIKIGRAVPMGTLSKYHKDEEVKKWLSSEDTVMLCPKYDGFGVELIYKEGNLVMASTRGTGLVGEDVLAAVMRIPNLPLHLPEEYNSLERVRGEVIIPRKNHEKVKALGYSAMRNAVPGIVRSNRKDALGYVDFVAYEFFDGTENRVEQRLRYSPLFTIEEFEVFKHDEFDSILNARNLYGEKKDSYLYEIDGTVLKTTHIMEDDLLCPAHQIAWKFKSNREVTTLRDIEWSMGVSGFFTPIGIFDEVDFQGAKLTRASLGNITRMKKEFAGMTVGSLVEVSRRGDIIPYIETLDYINDTGDLIEYPKVCPYCGETLSMKDEEPYCGNHSCPEKLRLQISQYAKAVGVKGIGDKLIRGMIDAGYLNSICDIYDINPDCILNIPRQGQSSVEKWERLQAIKLSPLELLTAYPFLNLGKKIWEVVLSKFSFNELLFITEEDLKNAKLRGIGDSKIEDIVSQIRENVEELKSLMRIHF